MEKEKYHKYEVSNWFNDYSVQRYPAYINSVSYSPIIGKKTQDGMLCVSVEDVDGHFCSILKCYKNAKGQRYCIFGKHRLYEGFSGPVEIINAPVGVRKTLREMGVKLSCD